MRVLLDECLPRRFALLLIGHTVTTVPQAGWAGRTNGELLELASTRFDVLITIDRSILSSLDVRGRAIAVIAIRCVTNRLDDLRPLAPRLLEALARLKASEVVIVGE